MATLQNTDQLLLNRSNVTYKGTMAQVSELVLENIIDGTSNVNLVLNTLGDVNTGGNGPLPLDQGKFLLCGSDGIYTPINFRTAVDAEIQIYLQQNDIVGDNKPSSVFPIGEGLSNELLDVDQSFPADPTKRYAKTFLLGQNYALGSGADNFRAVDFDEAVADSVNSIGLNIPVRLNDLQDVDYSGGIQRGDYLKYSTGGIFVEASLRNDVIEIIEQEDIEIPATSLPTAAYYDDQNLGLGGLADAKEASGIVAVRQHAGTDSDPQYLTIENVVSPTGGGSTVLDVQIPNIPDVFEFFGAIYFDEAGAAFEDKAGTTSYAPPADALRGNVYVALPTEGGTNDPTDSSVKRELLTWESAVVDDGVTGVDVARGSLVVCSLEGTGTSPNGNDGPQFAVMGELDYSPSLQDLQSVLDQGNTASNLNIELTNGSVELTMGNFSTTQGNVSTAKGAVYTEEGFIYTNKGSIRINGAYDVSDPLINILSVPAIDFDRFADISTAPTT